MTCVAQPRLLMADSMESIMDVPVLPGSRRHASARRLRGQRGETVVLIKRVFILVLLTCVEEAVGEREGRNELGGNESN